MLKIYLKTIHNSQSFEIRGNRVLFTNVCQIVIKKLLCFAKSRIDTNQISLIVIATCACINIY